MTTQAHYGNVEPLLKKVIPKPGTITVIDLAEHKVTGFNSSSRFLLIPNPKDKQAIEFCASVQPIGWDWRPEHLKQEQLPYNQMFIFFGKSYHTIADIEDRITKKFHIQSVQLSDSAFVCLTKTSYGGDSVSVMLDLDDEDKHNRKEDPNFERNSSVNPDTAYVRCRFLWKTHNTQFSKWETDFVKDIGKRLAAKKQLTEKQKQALGKLFGKYKVTQVDTASDNN
jgi:hypothetical protein